MKLQSAIFTLMLTSSLSLLAAAESKSHRGAAVYAGSGCSHCHTIRNVGGNKGPNLSGVGRKMKTAQMRQQIVHGSAQMPAFGDVLQPAEIEDLVAYLHSCRDKEKK